MRLTIPGENVSARYGWETVGHCTIDLSSTMNFPWEIKGTASSNKFPDIFYFSYSYSYDINATILSFLITHNYL